MVFSTNLFILLIVCAVICSIGFKKFVWFISIGYGFAITGAGSALLILYRVHIPLIVIIQCVLFIIYGIRLGGFLMLREIKSVSYRNAVSHDPRTSKKMSFPI